MWTEQTAFIESGKKKYLSSESNGGHEFEGLVGWGGVWCGVCAWERSKGEKGRAKMI